MGLSIYLEVEGEENVFEGGVTHNLNTMAEECGLYKAIWCPELIDANFGSDLIEVLNKGLTELERNEEYYKTFNAKNGWGKYEDLLSLTKNYLKACIENPDSKIWISR